MQYRVFSGGRRLNTKPFVRVVYLQATGAKTVFRIILIKIHGRKKTKI